MTGILQFAVRQGTETESYMTSAERVAEYAKIETEESVVGAKAPSKPDPAGEGVIQV